MRLLKCECKQAYHCITNIKISVYVSKLEPIIINLEDFTKVV